MRSVHTSPRATHQQRKATSSYIRVLALAWSSSLGSIEVQHQPSRCPIRKQPTSQQTKADTPRDLSPSPQTPKDPALIFIASQSPCREDTIPACVGPSRSTKTNLDSGRSIQLAYRGRSLPNVQTTIFSPDGRLYQVEYALEAISHAGTAIGILAKDGIVLAAERKVTSKLLEQDTSAEKLYILNEYVSYGSCMAGSFADLSRLAAT